LLILVLFVLPLSGLAGESVSRYKDQSQPTNVYWGDTHVHTSNSFDAGVTSAIIGPEEAYRYARGEKVESSDGTVLQLIRPLDFLVVSDHAEYLGVWNGLRASDPLILKTKAGRRWHDLLKSVDTGAKARGKDTGKGGPKGDVKRGAKDGGKGGSKGEAKDVKSGGKGATKSVGKGGLGGFYQVYREVVVGAMRMTEPDGETFLSEDFKRSVWERNCEAADRLNQPGRFTALIGFEWTSTPGGNNLHRNVIFKDGAKRATRLLPYSQLDSMDPEDLWQYLARYEETTEGNVLAIPHNGNFSNGLMFAVETFTGQPLTRDYAATRSRWEPLFEISQIKGDSEAHPALSPNDEFADYRTLDKGNMREKSDTPGAGSKKASMLPHEYARSALKLGLELEDRLGVNPFKFGVVGSTDTHTGLTTDEQDSFIAKRSVVESARAVPSPSKKGGRGNWRMEQVAGGLAAVWSTENTRDGLFEAMERKETYATTGPRMTVRFFGGWNYVAKDAMAPDLATVGYAKGVPMGGDLSHAPDGKSPTFLLRAVKDPDGANLDRMQIIKGWRDETGGLHEKVYNVALSDGRVIDSAGRVEPVGNTVDVKNASYTNSIGDSELAVVWADPDFDEGKRAFYYARVLEIPTPRWTDFESLGMASTEGIPMTIAERAYTSPIWYTP
jgi:hypothetical protein